MKLIFSIILIIISLNLLAADKHFQFVSDTAANIGFPTVKNTYIRPGERFEFKVRWGFITVGSAVIGINKETEYINDREVMVAVTTARTASFFDPIYKVRDSITSYIDKEGLFSWKFVKIQREGPYMRDEIINYDYFNNKFVITTIRYKDEVTEKTEVVNLESFVQDVLSCLYLTRIKDLKVDKSYLIPTNSQNYLFDIEVNVLKKERISVPAGRFNTIVIEPNMKGQETIFKQEGSMKIWLTDDEYKMPVKMESQILIGSIKATLTDYHIPQK